MIDFNTYDKQNPEIWMLFKKFANEAKYDKKFKNYSANGIFELIRWQTSIQGNDGYKVNNNYRPDYARKMMEQYPAFKDFFRVRELKASRNKYEEVLFE